MASRKTENKKTKSPKASIEKTKKGPIQKKKPDTAKASQIGKKSRPSRGFKKLDPIQTENTSMAIVLASSLPTQPQASKKAPASTSGKGTPPPKAGSNRNIMLEEGECAEIRDEISRRGWDFFCLIAGQGRQSLTHEFYTNGWKPKPKAVKMGDLLPIPRAWGAFIIASILPVLHDTTLLLDRVKLLFEIIKRMDIDVGAVISKEMENIMLTKKKSLAYSSLITLLCLDARVNLSDDDVPISAAKAISTRRISEYELAFQKKQPNVPSTSRPPPPRHQTQAEINQMILDNQVRILDNQVMIQNNQAVLALRQDVLYAGLRRGQIILAKNLIDIPGRVHVEAPPFLSSADLDDDLLGEHLGHKTMAPFPAASQSSGDQDNDDNEPTTS
ncbi:hypothetical protein SESBI_21158 [Sesbania bispinosa]|nr:hypothetical protein SESBI_21158 [Sesbania bispinosa]